MDAKSRTPLTFGHYYHIYNRGINGCELYSSTYQFRYFLFLYTKYISPIAITFSWCLMNNHFHFLLKIKELNEIQASSKETEHFLSRQFASLFSTYAMYFNKISQRHGSLFERPFKRKLVDTEDYLKKIIVYLHTNPIHHQQVDRPEEYRWSSYNDIIQGNTSFIDNIVPIKYFEDLENFIFVHQQKTEVLIIENW